MTAAHTAPPQTDQHAIQHAYDEAREALGEDASPEDLLAGVHQRLPDRLTAPEETWQTLLLTVAADDPLGLHLFAVCLGRLETADSARQVAFCETVQEQAPNTRVSAAALDQELRLRLAQSEESFLACVSDIVAQNVPDTRRRVALFRRMEYLRENGKPREAAADALRLLAGEKNLNPGLRTRLVGILQEARLPFEAEMAALEAPFMPDHISGALKACIDAGASGDESWVTAYLDGDPDWVRRLPDEANAEEHVAFWARRAYYQPESAPDDARATALAYVSALEALADDSSAAAHFGSALALHAVLMPKILAALGADLTLGYRWDSEEKGPSEEEVQELGRAYTASVMIAAQCLGLSDVQRSALLALMTERQVLFWARYDPGRVEQCYTFFLKTCADSVQAPEMMHRHAAYVADALGDYQRAGEMYRDIRKGYAGTSWEREALLGEGHNAFRLQRYKDARICLSRCLIQEDGLVGNQALARTLLADCEERLGDREAAFTQMTLLTEETPASPYAERAFLWLAGYYAEARQTEKALACTAKQLEFFPYGYYAEMAESFGKRLNALQVQSEAQ